MSILAVKYVIALAVLICRPVARSTDRVPTRLHCFLLSDPAPGNSHRVFRNSVNSALLSVLPEKLDILLCTQFPSHLAV